MFLTLERQKLSVFLPEEPRDVVRKVLIAHLGVVLRLNRA